MSFIGDIVGGNGAKKAADYNAQLIDRNAKIKDQEAQQGYQVFADYDLKKFDNMAANVDATVRASFGARGVEMTGTAYDVLLENKLNLDRDRNMMFYNAEVKKDRTLNDAINMRAEAAMQRYKGAVAQSVGMWNAFGDLIKTGTSIYTGGGGSGSGKTLLG
jgi:hypothetical protein